MLSPATQRALSFTDPVCRYDTANSRWIIVLAVSLTDSAADISQLGSVLCAHHPDCRHHRRLLVLLFGNEDLLRKWSMLRRLAHSGPGQVWRMVSLSSCLHPFLICICLITNHDRLSVKKFFNNGYYAGSLVVGLRKASLYGRALHVERYHHRWVIDSNCFLYDSANIFLGYYVYSRNQQCWCDLWCI